MQNKPRVLLVNVPLRPRSPLKRFPLGLGYIATAVHRAGYQVTVVDQDLHALSLDSVEEAARSGAYSVVMLGTIVSGYRRVKEVLARLRLALPDALFIVGNSVASSIPRLLLERTEADVAVDGEGDVTAVEILRALERGESLGSVTGITYKARNGGSIDIITTPRRPAIENLDSLPPVDFELFDIERYLEASRLLVSDPLPMPRDEVRAFPVSTSRGCLYRCTFCYFVNMDSEYRTRSPEHFLREVAELQRKYGMNYAILDDELTFFNRRQTEAFADAILASGLRFYWIANCRAGLLTEPEDRVIVDKLKRAGCHGLRYSLESADMDILKAMKRPHSIKRFEQQTAMLHAAGLQVWTSVVIGYPQETPETIARTFDVCVQNRIFPSVGFLLPQPGSPMWDHALNNGYIPDVEAYLLRMGDRIDLHVNMTTMSDATLKAAVRAGLRRVNEVASVSTIELTLPCSADREAVHAAVGDFASSLSKWGGVSVEWSDEAARFVGTSISGKAVLVEDALWLRVTLGLQAKSLGGDPAGVRRALDALQLKLSPNREGSTPRTDL